MAKAVKSDGEVNQLVSVLALASLAGEPMGKREDVDKVLKDDKKLTQCNYETLLVAGAAYFKDFKEKNWFIQKHIEIKAQQSETYRRFKAGNVSVSESDVANADDAREVSPLAKLLSR